LSEIIGFFAALDIQGQISQKMMKELAKKAKAAKNAENKASLLHYFSVMVHLLEKVQDCRKEK
jgi:hypothetical protein